MSYIFSDSGLQSGYYRDADDRVFVLNGLNSSLDEKVVAEAIARCCPSFIAHHRVLLTLPEHKVRDLAATVFSESSHDPGESEGIMRVMRNRAELKGAPYQSSGFWSDIGARGIDGRGTANYRAANATPLHNWHGNMRTDLRATIRGLVGSSDVSGGAYFWIATSIKSGNNIFAKGLKEKPPIFVVTTTLGGTTFLKYNSLNPKYGRHHWP
jgi:hypothetical protein